MTLSGRSDAIEHLFHPRNVALVGVSDRPGHWSQRVYENLKRFGFAGTVYPVNPNRSAIWGARCYPKLDVLPEAPDHLAIFTPAEATIRILEDGAAVGARSATVYAAGFGEGGDSDGRKRGTQLRETIARTGIAVIGPTGMGVACGAAQFATIPDESLQQPMPSPVAIALQSGAMATVINRAINDLGLRTAYLASCGSQLGLRISDFIDYFAGVPELRVILCYIEGVPDAAHFLESARRARANGKVVVAVKVGASESSRAAALAHTGSLAGSAEAFDAVAGGAGVIRFGSLEDAIEAVEFLARQPLPRGRKVAVMSNSGALRSLITEAAERTTTTLASLSDATTASLGAILEQTKISNPLDTIRTISEKQYAGCLNILTNAAEVDIVLVAEDLPINDRVDRRLSNLLSIEGISQRSERMGKTVAMFTPLIASATDYGRSVRERMPHVPILRGMERALRIVNTLACGGARPIHNGPFFAKPADTEPVTRWRTRSATLDRPTALNEVESKALLAEFGIPLPPERLARSPDEAVSAAQAIGFPVVLKAVSAALPHKSDAGLVHLNLGDSAAVRQAAVAISSRASALHTTLEGLLVAKQVSGGTEVVLGVQRDVEMGPVVMFGLGGVTVELFKDVSFAPAMLDPERAREMVYATRARALLTGYRGRKPDDVDALCVALTSLGRLARELGNAIESIDINPLLVQERGVVALDALVVLRPPISEAC